MNLKMKKTLILFLLGCLSFPVFAQSVSTQGKEFWLSFMHNGYYDRDNKLGVTLQVIISAKRDCSGTIANSLAQWSQSFSVEANGVTTITIPTEVGYHDGNNYEITSGKGIHILADDTISVYCANIADYSFDASFVLPIDGLGDSYIIQCAQQSSLSSPGLNNYKVQNQTSAFLIVATEDNTVVNITPAADLLGGTHPAGSTFSVTLNAGQTYHVRSVRTGEERDLSGTRVTADDCKKIAVFNGNTLTRLPVNLSGTAGFEHVFEQAMPVRSWGRKFVVTQSLTRSRDIVKIVSAANGNEISRNGTVIATLNACETCEFFLNATEASCFLETSKASAVYLYNTSASDDRANGDPSMVWIAPVEQRIDEMTFTTFSGNSGLTQIDNHYVNIIVGTEDADKVYLDGSLVPASEFSHVNGNAEYSYARKPITHRSHHLACANGFNAHVYGFGDARGYAYLVGSNAIDLSTTLIINDLVVSTNDVFQYCIEEEVVFSAEVNYQDYELVWDFGDGTTSTDNPAHHVYYEKHVYPASLVVTTDESGCVASASDTTLFFVDVTQQYLVEHDETCMGAYYTGFGFENILIFNDTILCRTQPNPDNPRCTDSLLVYVTAWPTYTIPLFDNRCWTGTPGVYNQYGFDFSYDRPDTTYVKRRELETVNGCDSIVILTLVVGDFDLHEPDVRYVCYEDTPSFTWDVNGETYSVEGHYADTLPDGDCYTIYSLDLHFMQIPETIVTDTTVCGSYTWPANGTTYTETTNDTYSVPLSPFPCEQTYELHLTVNDASDPHPLYFSEECDSVSWQFGWNGETYTFFNDTIVTLTIPTTQGCDSIVSLTIHDMKHTPTPRIAYADDSFYQDGDTIGVVTNTEFFSFQYDFFVEDTLGHIGDWDSCVWQISKASWTIEPFTEEDEPDKRYCKVNVAERDELPVELSCTIYNSHCLPDSVLIRRIYLKSSFFGLDEQDDAVPGFSVAPNPNSGQMTLRFENMAGKVNVKVYDMHGILIDCLDIYNNLKTNTLQYNFRNPSAGIYYFVATAKEGTLTRKVVVAP